MRLATGALSRLPADVARPTYGRVDQAAGIVHLGIGAFHRAHQAWYTDAALNAGERDWLITGVSLRSPAVAEQMNPQDGLYAVAERSAAGTAVRVCGAVRKVLVASANPEAVIAALAAPTTHIVSLTVTEKGYCRAPGGGLDPTLADGASLYRFVTAGLRRRHDAGLPGVTLLSCDNLVGNGRQLAALMRAYLDIHDPALIPWFDAACTCPSTMVDRIVPATTDANQALVAEALGGLTDAACVVTEPFSQWVMEDHFAGPRPRWEDHGAQFAADVTAYETAKLRMLNGAHSLLAYCGLMRGHDHVHEAIADPHLRALVTQLMLGEAAPTITVAPGQNLAAYAAALVERFANPALNHSLAQIAMDGSQKVPQRWLDTVEANRRLGRDCPAIGEGLDAWFRHLRGANGPVDDPLAPQLQALARSLDNETLAGTLFGPGGLLSRG